MTKYTHSILGYNSRLDEIQATILLEKFKFLDIFIKKRIEIAKNYTKELKDFVKTPNMMENYEHTFHQYCIETPYQDELMDFLAKKQIASAIYYPIPLHLQKAFHYLGYNKGDFPIAEKAAQNILALPIGPTLTKEKQDYIITVIKEFFTKK